MLSKHQNSFIDHSIKTKGVRDCISSPKEDLFMELLVEIGLQEDKDFKHQFCLHNDDVVIVVDFCLLKERVIVEIDGEGHRKKSQRDIDILRDKICHENGYVTVRIKNKSLSEKYTYWRTFFAELVKDENIEEDD